jgi:hypothetical protein
MLGKENKNSITLTHVAVVCFIGYLFTGYTPLMDIFVGTCLLIGLIK